MRTLLSSLRARLVLIVLGAWIPVFALIGYLGMQQQQAARAEIEGRAQRLAATASSQAQVQLQIARQGLFLLSQLPAVWSEDPSACTGALDSLLAQGQLSYINVGRIDPSGTVSCSAVPSLSPASFVDDPAFQEAVGSGRAVVGPFGPAPPPLSDRSKVDFFLPIPPPSEDADGVLFATIDDGWLKAIADQARAAGGGLAVVDEAGSLVARSYPTDIESPGAHGVIAALQRGRSSPAADDEPFVVGTAPLFDAGSEVRVALPVSLAAEAQRRALVETLVVLCAVVLLAIAAAWIIAELAILRPVRVLVRAARRLGTGDLSAESSIPYTSGELGELARAFDDAANELRAREEQIRQSQKLEALGLMAGGIAHDFNNLVTGVIGFSGLVLAKLPAGDPLRTFVVQIEAAGQRAANLTRQLLAFSRRQPLQPQVLDPNMVISDLEGLLRRALGEHIELIATLDPEVGHIEVDRGQLEQVLVNLAVNARDAMPDGGRLSIKTGNVVLGEEFARQHVGAQVGHHAMISVTDTGTGMDQETQARIFEPFFTTKEPGKGTGLGLSTVYGIVSQSGGSIWVYSEVGQGTTFRIYLPRVDKPLSEVGYRESSDGLPHGEETVLLVEDDRLVRSFATTVLESLGYTVLVAGGAHDALPVLASRGRSINLMLTDLVMPGMSGRELANKIMTEYPNIKVLYMSGFDPDTQIGQRSVPYGAPFLQKPFSPATLSQKVREALRS